MVGDDSGSPRQSRPGGEAVDHSHSPRSGVPRRRALVILGAHRSGTSAVTRVLNLLGANLPQHLMPGNSANPPGYWEPLRLVQLNDDLLASLGSYWDDWRAFEAGIGASPAVAGYQDRIERLLVEEYGDSALFVLKDPRLCRLVPVYEVVFSRLDIEPLYVLINRDPLDVAASLMRRDSFTAGFACLLWLRHELEAEATTRHRPRALVSFESLRRDWRSVVATISEALDLRFPIGLDEASREVEDCLAHVPRGNGSGLATLGAHPVLATWVNEVHAALTLLEQPDTTASEVRSGALTSLDHRRAELDRTARILGAMVYEELDWRKRRRLRESGRLPERMIRLEPVVSALEESLAVRDSELRALETRNAELEAELDLARTRLERASDVLRQVLSSNSWRLTAPLRALRNALRRGTGGTVDEEPRSRSRRQEATSTGR